MCVFRSLFWDWFSWGCFSLAWSSSFSVVPRVWIVWFISRPGQSQELLYKQPHDSLSQWVSQHFSPTASRRCHAQTVRDSSSSYKIDYVRGIKIFLNPKRHQNPISGSKVTAILLKGWILPIGGASAGEGLLLQPAQHIRSLPSLLIQFLCTVCKASCRM